MISGEIAHRSDANLGDRHKQPNYDWRDQHELNGSNTPPLVKQYRPRNILRNLYHGIVTFQVKFIVHLRNPRKTLRQIDL